MALCNKRSKCSEFDIDAKGCKDGTCYEKSGAGYCCFVEATEPQDPKGQVDTNGYMRTNKSELTYTDWFNMINQASNRNDIEAMTLIAKDILDVALKAQF